MNETNKVRVLGIVGSPRRGGNTELLVDEVLAGAKDAGAEIKKIILNDLKIGHCQGCNACSENGQCKYSDDMDIINEEMNKSTAFVYGTPVYYWGPTGIFKTFYDRLLATSRKGFIKDKKVVFVVPLGGSESVARHTVGMLKDSTNYMKATIVGQVVTPGTMERKDLDNKPEVLQKARDLGKELASK
ncbi:MAG: flavodoxin family protein [Candidatus Heimdallarchaeota archaeon]|nr:flavodoxin family protein [Candidatus Heimdallarchaeota archaeon]MBY8994402.1 flavodoxin family protein [Candidatus Heimdallarchaeota archaeon]